MPDTRRLIERAQAWFWKGGVCKICTFPVVVMGSKQEFDDYQWYCSNVGCLQHYTPEHTGDQEVPKWVTEDEI